MGYDFLMLELPDSVASLRAAYDRTLNENRMDQGLSAAFFDAAEEFSYHLNLAGIGFCREAMSELGMLADGEPEPFPAYPEWDRLLYATASEHRLANPKVWADYEASERRAMAQSGEGPEIARFKLLANDSWIVTRDEIAVSLAHYDALPADRRAEMESDDLWTQWIRWLRRASAGFEVG